VIKQTVFRFQRILAVLLLVFLFTLPVWAGGEISFREFSIQQGDNPGELLANMKLDYQLTPYLRDGLLNGMTLVSEIDFNLEWHNSWWWNSSKPLDVLKTELKYHSLSEHYQLVRMDTNENWNFPTLASALDKMGTLDDYPLPELPKNAFGADASIFVTAKLEAKSLNLPLQLGNLFSDRYSLESEGVVWPIP
jgi:hypothetical protein